MFRVTLSLCGLMLGALLLPLMPAWAGPLGPFNLEEIIAHSDAVVVVTPLKTPFHCRVDAVYHGTAVAVGETIELSYPAQTNGPDSFFDYDLRRVISDEHLPLCLFLRRSANGEKTFTFTSVEVYSGFRVAGKRPEGKLVGKEALEAEILQGLLEKDLRTIDDAVIWAEYLKSPRLRKELERLAAEKKPALPILAWRISDGILHGRRAAMEELIAFKEQYPETLRDAVINPPIPYETSRLRIWHLNFYRALTRVPVVDDRAYFHRILCEDDWLIACSLASSVDNWADETAIPTLIETLDRFKSYSCLHALGRLTGRPVPKNEQEFTNHRDVVIVEWLRWWKEEGKVKYGDG